MRIAHHWIAEMKASHSIPPSLEDDLRWIRRIQADALRWALEQVIPDGNPQNISAKIRAKLNELEQ